MTFPKSKWKPLEDVVPEKYWAELQMMYMGIHSENGIDIHLYKSKENRRYINIDNDNNCYTYAGDESYVQITTQQAIADLLVDLESVNSEVEITEYSASTIRDRWFLTLYEHVFKRMIGPTTRDVREAIKDALENQNRLNGELIIRIRRENHWLLVTAFEQCGIEYKSWDIEIEDGLESFVPRVKI